MQMDKTDRVILNRIQSDFPIATRPFEVIAAELGLGAGESVLYLERVRSRDGQPFGHYASWTSGLDAKLGKRVFSKAPRLEVFRENGLRITHVTQTLSAAAATEELARNLDTEVGAPLIEMIRHSFTTVGGEERMVDYLHAHYHPERFQYQMDLTLDDQ